MDPIENFPVAGQFNTICPVCKAILPSPQAVCAGDGVRGVPDIPPQKIPGYEFIGLIGAGGMGVIYKARHELMGKTVAIKLLPPTNVTEKSMLRFYEEAKAVSKLRHPNIVAIHNFGVLESGVAYMILDFIEGITLKEFIDTGRACPLPVFCDILEQCCEALAHAHKHGILHRDIKPANIMLTGSPFKVSILDFGIAEMQEATARKLDMTKTGEIMGTPLYVSPEHIKGLPLDARADVYSLGCVMFELLAGQPPFRKSTAFATISSHLNGPIPQLPDQIPIARKVKPILDKMLAKDRKKRYASMAAVQTDVFSLEKGIDPRAKETKLKIAAAISGALVLLVVCGTLLFYFKHAKKDSKQVSQVDSTVDAVQNVDAKTKYFLRDFDSRTQNTFHNLLSQSDGKPEAIFENQKLTDYQLSELQRFPRFRNLYIANNLVTDDGLKSLEGLPLTFIDVSGNKITDAGLKSLAAIATLEQLDLDRDKITDAGVKFLSRLSALWELSLDETEITDEASKTLSKMESLESVSLAGNNEITDESVRNLSRLPRLKVLNLRGANLSDDSMAFLPQCKFLHNAAFSGKRLTNLAIPELKKTKISELELSNCSIDDRGLEKLAGMKGLRSLNIYDCPITEAGLKKFALLAPQTQIKNAARPPRSKEVYRL